MSVYKCKMCGGTLEVDSNSKVVTCDYCGTTQTVYSFDNEKKENLFKRANLLRFKNDFEVAATLYQSILNEFPNEPEACWGLVLCKYGLEYIDDSKSGKKIPICHRTQYKSVFDDDNYKNALNNADTISYNLYEMEAKEIDRLQKAIIKISQQEDPYDIFICYKENDSNNNRTEDSVIGQHLYEYLTDKGYKVFFSKVTLANRLGYDFEPYIFAALQSSKVMVLISTSSDYIDSPWVKNEWSRYLKLVNESRGNKYLVTAYKNMSISEFPDELRQFQGQDLNKIGGFEDLTLGIQSLLKPNLKKKYLENDNISTLPTTESLRKRAFIFVGEGNWKKATEYFEKCLDINPEDANCYIGLFLCEHEIGEIEEIHFKNCNLNENSNFQMALKFSNGSLNDKLHDILNENLYLQGKEKYSTGDYSNAICFFNKISNYKDSMEYLEKCRNGTYSSKYNTYTRATLFASQNDILSQQKAIFLYEEIIDYKDSKECIQNCKQAIKKLKGKENIENEHNKKTRAGAIILVISFIAVIAFLIIAINIRR